MTAWSGDKVPETNWHATSLTRRGDRHHLDDNPLTAKSDDLEILGYAAQPKLVILCATKEVE